MQCPNKTHGAFARSKKREPQERRLPEIEAPSPVSSQESEKSCFIASLVPFDPYEKLIMHLLNGFQQSVPTKRSAQDRVLLYNCLPSLFEDRNIRAFFVANYELLNVHSAVLCCQMLKEHALLEAR